ncbi:hypothetical protein ebA1624 [Aromatoleum aromaticum EbN1]|uniref:Uncharacterized protein n=1 Tax=Aromatoleum aromaticum (strain DSM 19018 / LMG 30748 / EbN1) TaxID=76114 RepID=Q5P6Q2_AROAE|nr:hypothetical protein ebA1624 [Aromatoleum aromaticum EbN1]
MSCFRGWERVLAPIGGTAHEGKSDAACTASTIGCIGWSSWLSSFVYPPSSPSAIPYVRPFPDPLARAVRRVQPNCLRTSPSGH